MRNHYLLAMIGIVRRELMRFVHQRARFIAALVRPLLWLVVFAAGFRAALGLSIIPPYQTYISYEVYIVPGLIGMIQLFNGMQSSLSMVYDQEMGSMRILLTAPLPRWYLLFCKLVAGVVVSVLQIAAFLLMAGLAGIDFAYDGWLLALPVLIVTGIMLGSLGLLIAS
jgi:ABC-2 type transport system permease protein